MGVDPAMLALPTLSGNPFEIRPLSIGQAQDLIGRDEIVMECREHLISGSSRMVIINGVRGSGRTSLLNAIASQTSNPFISDYWPMDADPVKNMVTQVAAHFTGHNLPSVISETISNLSRELENKDGPIPMIAFDLPYNVEVSTVIPRLIQIMQKMRGLVIFTMLPRQLASLEEETLDIFDTPYLLRNFRIDEIQLLVDRRISRVARQRWMMHPILLKKIHELTEGLPRAVVRTLRDLVDEKRGISGRSGSLERLVRWSEMSQPVELDEELPPHEDTPSETTGQEPISSIYDYGPPQQNETIVVEDMAETEYVALKEQDEDNLIINHQESLEQLEIGHEATPDFNGSASNRSTDATQETTLRTNDEEDGYFWMEPGTEPPPIDPQHKTTPKSAFSGLHERTNATSFEMPTDGGDSEIIDASEISNIPFTRENVVKIEPSILHEDPKEEFEESPVVSTNQAVWTVSEDFEATLPPIIQEVPDPHQGITSPPQSNEYAGIGRNSEITFPEIYEPVWEKPEIFNFSYVRKLTKSEKLILIDSSKREISPSDPELQARLEVGRPRLSQIFNKLQRNGFLKVRKEGRVRYFTITEEAYNVLR